MFGPWDVLSQDVLPPELFSQDVLSEYSLYRIWSINGLGSTRISGCRAVQESLNRTAQSKAESIKLFETKSPFSWISTCI
jgi:hypothetical protein